MGLPNLERYLVERMGWDCKGPVPTKAQLRQWQMGQLQRLVAHAKANSPFYAKLFQDIDTCAFKTPEDFARVPFITADDLRTSPERLLTVSQDGIERVVTVNSSGTTGRPKRIFYTAEDLAATTLFFRWGMANMVGPCQTAMVLMPEGRTGGVGRLLGRALEQGGAEVVLHGELEDANRCVDHLLQSGARCIVGSANHCNLVAGQWARRGLPRDHIKSVLLCWDVIPQAVVRNVREAFGCRVFRHWGMIETGLGGAVDCQSGTGMHLRESDVYIEIIDPETGRLLPDGDSGEMVVTTLLKTGMPLIRYRTGDTGRFLPGTCSCGSPQRRLDPDVCRINDGVDIGGGLLRLPELNECLFSVNGVDDFTVHYGEGVLHFAVSGHGEDLRGRVIKALNKMDVIAQSMARNLLDYTVETNNGAAPAVSGMGKRCIQVL